MASKKKAPKKAPRKKTPVKANKKKAAKKKVAPKKKTKRAVAAKKKTAPRKSVRAAAKKKPAAPKPRVRRDATGHLDPNYERDLRRISRETAEHDDDRAFLVGERKNDALAQELGREFVETVTSGEDEGTEIRDEFVAEEVGGPFVRSTRGQEVAEEPDESNPVDATREPFPTT